VGAGGGGGNMGAVGDPGAPRGGGRSLWRLRLWKQTRSGGGGGSCERGREGGKRWRRMKEGVSWSGGC
jgi:hypothetical protein